MSEGVNTLGLKVVEGSIRAHDSAIDARSMVTLGNFAPYSEIK